MKKHKKDQLGLVSNQEIVRAVIARKFREDKEFRTKVIPNKKKKCQKKNLEDYLD